MYNYGIIQDIERKLCDMNANFQGAFHITSDLSEIKPQYITVTIFEGKEIAMLFDVPLFSVIFLLDGIQPALTKRNSVTFDLLYSIIRKIADRIALGENVNTN